MEIAYGETGRRLHTVNGEPEAVLSREHPTEVQEPISRASVAGTPGFTSRFSRISTHLRHRASLLRKKLPGLGSSPSVILSAALEARQFRRQFPGDGHGRGIRRNPCGGVRGGSGAAAVVPDWALIEELPLLRRTMHGRAATIYASKFRLPLSGTIGMKHDPALLLGELAQEVHR